MSFPKYKFLLTYRYAEIISDLTVEFTRLYIDRKSRTFDQMIQAARSGKQNIVEAVGESATTKKGEIKLLGIAKGSFEELLADFEDYARQNNLQIYPKSHPKINSFRKLAYRLTNLSNLSDLGHLRERPELPENPTDDVNFLITLCHQETFLLNRQIIALVDKFEKEGGFTESLFRRRVAARKI